MAANDHSYCLAEEKLSDYAKRLDVVSKRRYIEKLIVQVQPGKFYSVPDPYLLTNDDWKSDVRQWPKITYPDIFNYLVNSSNNEFDSKNLKNYKSLSAYEYVESGKVETVKSYKPAASCNITVLSAEVQPSQRLREKNHVAWTIAENDGVVISAHCSCMAGIGEACSHIAALLFKVELALRLQYTSEKTPTEEACRWNSTFSSKKVLNVPVSAMNLQKVHWGSTPKRKQQKRFCYKVPDLPPFTEEEMKRLREVNGEAVIFLSQKRLKTDNATSQNLMPPLLLDIISSYNGADIDEEMKRHFTPLNCKLLAEKTAEQRVCKTWHQHRQGRFTASNFKEVIKRKNWDDAYIKKFVSSHKFSNQAMNWGIDKEDEALASYKKQLGQVHKDLVISKIGLLVNPDMPYLGATPDAIVCCSCCGRGVVEIKCPYVHRNNTVLAAANTDKNFCLDAMGILKKSHKYFYQIQGQMAVASVQYCDFVVWTINDCVIQRITKDGGFWEDIHTDLKDIYFQHLVPFIKHHKSEKDQKEDDISS